MNNRFSMTKSAFRASQHNSEQFSIYAGWREQSTRSNDTAGIKVRRYLVFLEDGSRG